MRFQAIFVGSLALSLVAGCGSSAVDDGADAGTHDAGAHDAGASDAGTSDAGVSDAGPADAGIGASQALLRVHYPVASGHSLALRGGGGPLNWSAGQPFTASGNNTWSYSFDSIGAALELKPLLDDSAWSRGPNYRIAPGQVLDIYPHFQSTAGSVQTLISGFHSNALNNDRDIYIYYPASYSENSEAAYPVVYMHDGQNLWAALPQLAFSSTWNVDTAFDAAAEHGTCSADGLPGWAAQPLGGTPATCTGDGDCASGECRTFPEAIVIGVANTSGRIYEYTPTTDPTTPGGGGGDLYLQMLVTELKPAVEAQLTGRYKTGPANTALAGSSLGGLISSYIGVKRPDIYGLIGAVSPSTWWNGDVLLSDVAATQPAPNRPLRVYVDSGSGDADDESDTDMLSAAYIDLGYQEGIDYHHVVQQGAQHSEIYWAERFPGAIQTLLGER